MKIYHINIVCREDLFIAELADMITKVVDFKGVNRYDSLKPDGSPGKLLDITGLNNLGWESTLTLQEGIKESYKWYLENHYSICN